jgi:hypothetical protein
MPKGGTSWDTAAEPIAAIATEADPARRIAMQAILSGEG